MKTSTGTDLRRNTGQVSHVRGRAMSVHCVCDELPAISFQFSEHLVEIPLVRTVFNTDPIRHIFACQGP